MEFKVESSGTELAGEEAGEGSPVVLLHGLTATRRYVVMGSKYLERYGHRVISYDARGHGESEPAASKREYAYDDLAADLEAVLDRLGVERAVLVGASMGAHTAVRFALRSPDRVGGMVVITPGFAPDHGSEEVTARYDAYAAGLRSAGIDGFLAAMDQSRLPEQWRETVMTVIRQRLSGHRHLEAVADALEVVPRSRPFESWGQLAQFEIPTLVVGSRDEADPDHPLHVAERYAAAIPNAELRVEEPGRSPLAWQGGQLSKLIAEFSAERVVAARG
jgi:3-oxoadipate enol-lactonase